MIKSLITAAVLAASTLVALPEAQARTCHDGSGYRMCTTMVSRNGAYNSWLVEYSNQYGTEVMNVTCLGKDVDTWNSTGPMNQAGAERLAETFCAA